MTAMLDDDGQWLVGVPPSSDPAGRHRVWWRFLSLPFGQDGGRGVLVYECGLTPGEAAKLATGVAIVASAQPYRAKAPVVRHAVALVETAIGYRCVVPPGVAPSVVAAALVAAMGQDTEQLACEPVVEAEVALLRRKECVGRRLTVGKSDTIRVCVDVDGDVVVWAHVGPDGKPRKGKRGQAGSELVTWMPEPEPEPAKVAPDRSPGRPHLSVAASLPREVAEDLVAVATREGLTQSAIIRRAVEAYLAADRLEPEPAAPAPPAARPKTDDGLGVGLTIAAALKGPLGALPLAEGTTIGHVVAALGCLIWPGGIPDDLDSVDKEEDDVADKG